MASQISSESLLLTPSSSKQIAFAQATGDSVFSNYNLSASNILTQAQVNTLVESGVATAIGDASAIFKNDAAFSTLFTNSTGIGLDGNFKVTSSSEAKVAASFSVAAHQTFSFNFLGNVALTDKEIEDDKTAYNEAKSKTTFLILDTSDVSKPKVLDYFGIFGDLSSPDGIQDIKISASLHVRLDYKNKQLNTDPSNDTVSLREDVRGTYEQKFERATNITVVEINESSVKLLGDTLTRNQDNKDALTGEDGNSVMVGRANHNTFAIKKDDLRPGKYDLSNFEVGKDEVELQGWGNVDASTWFNGIVSGHQLVDTDKGALLTLNPGEYMLFQGIHADQLSSANFHFL